MQKNIFRKGLVLGIIVLFVGASVITDISESIRESKNLNDVEDENDFEIYFFRGTNYERNE